MSEELLRSLLSLFAIISNADGKLDDREIMYINTFMEEYLGKEYAKKYRRLFIKYFHYTNRQPVAEETITEICNRINNNLDKKQKFIALVRLLEISVYNDDYQGHRRTVTARIAAKLNMNAVEFIRLENFIYATHINQLLDHQDLLIYSQKAYTQQLGQHTSHPLLNQTDICFLRNEKADMLLVKFIGNDNETLLDFNAAKNNLIYLFHPGTNIKMATGLSLHFSDIAIRFKRITPQEQFVFNAHNIVFKFEEGTIGLDGVSLSEGPGSLVAIMGGSGSGKTTLLNMLSGLQKPQSGSVTVNHLDLNNKEDAQQLKGFIGYVTQEDALIEELTVFQNLYFSAQLCFGKLNDDEIIAKVKKTLKDLGIYNIRHIKVGNALNKKISGGQRKRLNIALELIREPSILLLDEPTSGLSSKDSENVMDFIKQLTYKGKLVISVIHQPSMDLYKMFDKVIIMDHGGVQIYYGNPLDAIQHFKANSGNIQQKLSQKSSNLELVTPETIFNIVEEEFVDEYGNPTGLRKFAPNYWKNLFKKHEFVPKEAPLEPLQKTVSTPNWIRQFKVFLMRDLVSKYNNIQYMLLNAAVAPLLAIILSFIIKYTEDFSGAYSFSQNDNIPAYIFISIIVSLFMGMTLSAGEIIKDRKVLHREKILQLSWFSYLQSKMAVLFVISMLQTILFVGIANYVIELKGMNTHYCIMLFSTACFANILGLFISSSFNSIIAVYIAIPLLLVPQMILGGSIFSYDKLNKYISSKDNVPLAADLMVSRWAYEGLVVHQFKNNKFQKPFFDLEMKQSNAYYKYAFWTEHLLNKANQLKIIILEKPENYQEQVDHIVYLLQNELVNDAIYRYDSENFKRLKKGNYEAILDLIQELQYMKEFYDRQYRLYNKMEDNMVVNYLKTESHKALFSQTRKSYYNYAISNLVRHKNSTFKIQEHDHRIIQKVDPIYRQHKPNMQWYEYRTHFFCAQKNFLGFELPTFWANMIMIWILNIIFFIFLYFNVSKYVVYLKIKFR